SPAGDRARFPLADRGLRHAHRAAAADRTRARSRCRRHRRFLSPARLPCPAIYHSDITFPGVGVRDCDRAHRPDFDTSEQRARGVGYRRPDVTRLMEDIQTMTVTGPDRLLSAVPAQPTQIAADPAQPVGPLPAEPSAD